MADRSVFVSGIPDGTSQEQLADHFKSAGQVSQTILLTDSGTGRKDGTGFVVFLTSRASEKGIQGLNHSELRGEEIEVSALDRDQELLLHDLMQPDRMMELLSILDELSPTTRRRTVDSLQTAATDRDTARRTEVHEVAATGTQRIVVETTSKPMSRKLRLFSGKKPPPSGEVDFDTWMRQAEQLIKDDKISEGDKRRTITQSLLRPALDTVRSLEDATAKEYFELLINLYGSVEDGHELLVKFIITYQMEKEAASDYLQRLYLILVDAVDRKGLAAREIPEHLVRQFIRGSQDEVMIQKLKLEDCDTPLTFPDLLLKVRKEESRRTEKKLRLRSGKVQSAVMTAEKEPVKKEDSVVATMLKEMRADIQQLQHSVAQGSSYGQPNTQPSHNQGPRNYQNPQQSNGDRKADIGNKDESRKSGIKGMVNKDRKGSTSVSTVDWKIISNGTVGRSPIRN